MYEQYFGLREKPFSLLPDPSFLFLGTNHCESLTMLEYGLANQAGFTVLTGEVGSGKTTLIRYLLNQLGDHVRVGMITNTHASLGSLLQWVLASFELPYQADQTLALYERFVEFLVSEYAAGRRVILIVDEAQNMEADMLEELRMLSNINADKHQIIQIVLVGQPELRATLRLPALRQFAQRIAVDYHLQPLDLADTKSYILHRLEVAGGSDPIFTDGACEAVYSASEGIPRLINLICDTALVYAFGAQARVVGVDLVAEVLSDKAQGGLLLGATGSVPVVAPSQPVAAPLKLPSVSATPANSGLVDGAPQVQRGAGSNSGEDDVDSEQARELFSSLRRSSE